MKFKVKPWWNVWCAGELRYTSPWHYNGKEYPHGIVIVATEEDLQALCTQYAADVQAARESRNDDHPWRFDREHNGLLKGDTAATAWPLECKVENGRLYFSTRLTDDGEAITTGGALRYVSPEMDCVPLPGEEGKEIPRCRPVRITGATLTNSPRNRKLEPVCFSESENSPPGRVVLAGEPNQTNNTSMNKKALCALLGKPEDTADEELYAAAVAALNAGKTQAEEIKCREQLLAAHAGVIPAGEEESYRQLLTLNKEIGVKVLTNLKAAAAQGAVAAAEKPEGSVTAPVFNKQTAQTPAALTPKPAAEKPEAERTTEDHATVFNSMAPGAARTAYWAKHKDAIKTGLQAAGQIA